MRARMGEEDRMRWILLHKSYVNGLYELMSNKPLKEFLLNAQEGEDRFSDKLLLRYQKLLQHGKDVPAEGLSFYIDKMFIIGVQHAVQAIMRHGEEGYARMALMSKKMLEGIACPCH